MMIISLVICSSPSALLVGSKIENSRTKDALSLVPPLLDSPLEALLARVSAHPSSVADGFRRKTRLTAGEEIPAPGIPGAGEKATRLGAGETGLARRTSSHAAADIGTGLKGPLASP